MLYMREENAFRQRKSLDGYWDFSADKENIGLDNGWETSIGGEVRQIGVPASWNEQFNDLFNFHGKGYYQKDFFAPNEFHGKAVHLRFGSVAGTASVYLNGKLIMEHVGTALPFETDIAPYLNYGKKNRLVVIADSTLDPWSLPPAKILDNEGRAGFQANYPAVTYDFYPYGGIQRSVILYTTNKKYIRDITITTELFHDYALVHFTAELSQSMNGKLKATMENISAELPVNGDTACGTLRVENPRLWDIGKGELYSLTLSLFDGNVQVDEYTEQIGIRKVEICGNELHLNGRKIFLKGFGKHEDFYILGKGLHPAIVAKDFYLLNWIGANSFRTSHYPYDEQILEMADKNGILVIDETPFVGLNDRMYRPDILQKAKSVITELLTRDKNHPCVIMWSLANEPNVNTQEGKVFFEEMASHARSLDNTRPITYVAHLEPENNLGYNSYDLVCINKYYGWYDGAGLLNETLSHFADCIQRFYDAFQKPMIIAEFGADAIDGMHTDPPQMFSEEYQCETVLKQYAELKKKPYVIGAHVWAFADFKTAQAITRIILNRKGVFTRDRQPKMVAHALKKLWNEEQN